ncbi:hypothetical protein [Yersinia enterocolitica]|uniref:hypothetical protein n=1 Tax=Yersinia enterocolitica TaxID=630 RepID=UPI003F523C7F|nr:hypothetical protein [Yersinia enterocolitica]
MQKIGDIPNTRADSNGEFTDGNVAGGVPPTILPAEWFNTIQRELISILTAAGITPDSEKFDQIAVSISKLVSKGEFLKIKNNLSEIKAAGPAAVAEAQANLNLAELLGDALQKKNNLSEIAAAGSAAQAVAQANIGLTPSKFSGRLLNTQTFTATGAYTATAGTNFVIVEQIGAGGASGAISATASNQNSITCPGSNGVYAKAKFTSGFNGALVSIGAGGQPRLGNGFDGGNTSFGSLLVCPGGTGSLVGNPTIPPGYTSPQSGTVAPTIDASGILLASEYGSYLQPAIMIGLGVASNYASWLVTKFDRRGMGGNGRLNGANGTQQQGVAGNDGYCIVWEYA